MTNLQTDNNSKKQLPSTIFYAIACLLALFGLASWLSGNWQIATFGHDYIPMAPSTALLLIMLSSSVVFQVIYPPSKFLKLYSCFAITSTVATSLAVLGLHISGNWQMVENLFSESPEMFRNIPIGRMSPITAIIFLLNAASIIPDTITAKKSRHLFYCRHISAFISIVTCSVIFLSYASDAPLLYERITVPMALLTAVSFIFLNLGFLLSPEFSNINDYSFKNFSKGTITTFLVTSLIIGTAGTLFLKAQIRSAKNKANQELAIISDLKAHQISDWYEERRNDATVIQNTPAIQTQISRFLNDQGNDQDKKALLKWMETIEKESDYQQIILYDAKGIARLWTVQPGMDIIGSNDVQSFWEALHNKKTVTCDLHTHRADHKDKPLRIYMSILIPAGIFSDYDKSAEGVLMLHIDPYKHLYPLIQTWPTDSRTAETLLVRREGNEVLFLNELRHIKNTALSLRKPLNDSLPAAIAVKGGTGIFEGLDYRDRHVLSALNHIPETAWHLVSKIDIDEIYAPVIVRTWSGIGIILTLIFVTAMFFFIIEKQRRMEFYRSTLEKEQENLKIKDYLLESEKHFRSIFDQAAVGICYLDLDGKFMKVNNRFCEITGYPETELLNLTFREITHPDDLEADIIKVNELLEETIQTYSLEKRYLRKNQSVVWVNLTVSMDRFSDGSPKSFISIVEDISKKRKALSDLTESEERYAATLAAVNDGLWEWDVPSGNIFFSDHYYSILGYDAQEFSANYDSWRLHIHPEDIETAEQKIKSCLSIGQGFWVDIRMKTKTGDWKWVNTRGKVVERNENGAVKRMMGTLSDITERKQIENQVNEERERLQVTLRSIGDGVITTDTEARITLMNKIAEDLTGWKMNNAIGKPLDEIFRITNEYSKKPCENPAIRVLAAGEIIEIENNTVLTSRDGKEKSIEDSAAPIRDKNSKIIGVVIVFRDITEKHKTEEALQNAQKLESLSILAGGIAHDFNNLLGGIFGYLDMALEFASEEDFKGTQTTISSAMSVFERARDLTQQLLTFSRGGAPIRKTESLSKLVSDSVSFALTGSNVAMIFDIPDNIWLSYIDKNQMGQVIDNITINARQAMESGGTLRASLANIPVNKAPALLKPKNYVRVSISDNGPGIPKENISHIFDPFFTTKTHGNGLGLATCYSIVKRHDGLIEVESEKNAGTTFHIYIPASTEYAESIRIEARQDFKGQGKILVMDDEATLLKVTSAMLERFGYATVTASDGDEAIKLIKQAVDSNDSFFAAVLDLTIPGGKGGKEIVREINSIDPSVKVIASSGYSADSIMADPKKFGFVSCITKPFRIAELARMLESLSNDTNNSSNENSV